MKDIKIIAFDFYNHNSNQGDLKRIIDSREYDGNELTIYDCPFIEDYLSEYLEAGYRITHMSGCNVSSMVFVLELD